MEKLVKPKLFSIDRGLDPALFEKASLVDPILNCDTRLFIDPLLINSSANKKIKTKAYSALKRRFSEIVRLVDASERKDDAAWKAARKLLSLDERPETCLGYGGSGISGQRRPEEIKEKVLGTLKEIVVLGEKDPEIISLMGMFEEGVGPDTISDLTTTIILRILQEITSDFCIKNGIVTQEFPDYAFKLPVNPYRPGTPVILVPRDIVRDLPLAADWGDVSRVVLENEKIRDAFNRFVGGIAEASLGEKKAALKKAALSSIDNFRQIFEAVLGSSDHYDPNEDILNYYNFRKLMSGSQAAFKTGAKQGQPSRNELLRVVGLIISHFRLMVEKNNLWELLWVGERPKRERAAQLLFFAVSDLFCKANDIDISPETNMGGGPVDFKFSSGYKRRVLVEIKLSKGQVVHGYKKQLEIYKEAANTDDGIFLIIQVDQFGEKLKTIEDIRDRRLARNESVSAIEIVDARKKASASKRK